MQFSDVSVVIPTMTETVEFEQVVSLILESCDSHDIKEIIVVYSPRSSPKNLASVQKMKSAVESTGIDYITMCQRRPFYGGAMLDGIDAATGSHLLTMDGGMSTDPAKSPEMIVLAKQYPTHVIKGSRFKKGGSFGKNYPLPKLLWNVLSQLAVSVFYLTAFKDWTYAYLLAPTVYFQSVNWVELKHPLNLEFTLKFEKLGIHIREIAVKQAGGTASGYAETAGYLNPMLKVRFMKKSEILKPGVTLNL